MVAEVNGQQSSPLTSLSRLRKIDQLREKNIGKYLPLPQLVAVGDQSSGKSSLLESLTGIPFPHGQELCTRYATQITHRREDHPRIDIGIIPGPHASPAVKKQLESYHKEVQSTAQLRAEFPAILDDVNTLMNIKTSKNPTGDKTFTEDVLKIERCGPDEDYLTVIDVPGIFRITTEGVTTNKDKDLVRSMVKEYIQDSRTIILAVLPSNVDVATQEILALAEDYDKTGERTLGILTKPDLVTERSAKLAVCNLVEGKRKPLNLGYFLVRNRGGDDDEDDSSPNLREREDMFREYPWSNLADDRVGIVALRERLQELLGQITDRAFPKLRAEIRHMLEGAQMELHELGPPRQTEREQQQYLAAVAEKFQSLVRAALDADYSAHPAFDRDEFRLSTAVINITDQFNTDFDNSSRTYLFETETELRSEPATPATPDTLDFEVPEPDEFPDLHNIVTTDWTVQPPKAGIMDWIESVYRRSRGIEVGTFSPGIFSSVFREQSAKWGSITEQYLSRVILTVHRFILMALEVVCTDTRVREELTSAILSDLLAKYAKGMTQARFLVDVERQLKPYTLNHHFNSNRQESHGVRVTETLRPVAWKGTDDEFYVGLDKIATAVSNKSNAEHVREDIHDTLEAYYEVAHKRFVDNVFHQAVHYSLLSGTDSPLQLFSGQWVIQLQAEKLAAIAGESRLTRDRREKLKKKIQDLEGAMETLR